MTTADLRRSRKENGAKDREAQFVLSTLERRTLRYIHRVFGHQPFVLEQYLKQAPLESPRAEWHAGLLSLCRKQLVSIFRKTWGERMFQIPIADYLGQFSIWVPQLEEINDHMPCDYNIHLTDWRDSMPLRLLRLVLEIEREALRVTKQGRLHKRDQERLISQLGINHAELMSQQMSEQMPEQMPEQMSEHDFLHIEETLYEVLDLALRLELVRRDQGVIIVDKQRFTDWLSLEAGQRERDLFLVWYRVHCPDHAALHWLTGAVRNLPDEQWMSMDALLQIMSHHGLEGSLAEIDAWMLRLHAAGWIEHAIDEQGLRYVRRKPTWPEEQRTLLVQHDLEIILYPQTPYFVIRLLHQFAVSDRAAGGERYRITANSVQQAVDQGWDSDAIEHTLREHAVDDVPEHVLDLIREWEISRAVVRIVPGVILYAGTEQATSALRWNADRLGLQALNEQYWIAPHDQDQDIMRQLRSLGCQVIQQTDERVLHAREEDAEAGRSYDQSGVRRMADGSYWSEIIEQAIHPQAPGMFKPRDTSPLYRRETAEIGSDELFPDIQSIPAIWHQQYRGYHPYTAKRLLEQAIRWQTGVRLLASEDEHDFIPRSVEEMDGTWMVEGYCASEPMRLRLDEIEKLQLLMPDMNM